MPKCKFCGRTIPKSDKDLCRYCGGREPFDLVTNETKDITQFIDFDPTLNGVFKRKSLKKYSFLTMFLGVFAAHLFYVKKTKAAVVLLISNLIFIGGAGALLAKCIKSAELIAYEDLGAEALRKLYVEDMPLVVIIDSEGNNLYEDGKAAYLASKN